MIVIMFFENMVIDAFLACLFNVRYLIFLSMVHEYAYILLIYLEIGLLATNMGVVRIYTIQAKLTRQSCLFYGYMGTYVFCLTAWEITCVELLSLVT